MSGSGGACERRATRLGKSEGEQRERESCTPKADVFAAPVAALLWLICARGLVGYVKVGTQNTCKVLATTPPCNVRGATLIGVEGLYALRNRADGTDGNADAGSGAGAGADGLPGGGPFV